MIIAQSMRLAEALEAGDQVEREAIGRARGDADRIGEARASRSAAIPSQTASLSYPVRSGL